MTTWRCEELTGLLGCACVITTWRCESCCCEELTGVLRCACVITTWRCESCCCEKLTGVLGCACVITTLRSMSCTVRIYLMSFTCTFFSPLTVAFVALKDSPKFDLPCNNDSSSIWSGSSIGTLYFGSPAELQYVSAFIKTEILIIRQLTYHQTGCHLLIYSLSVVTTHLTVSTIFHHYKGRPVTAGKENDLYLCDSCLYSTAM